MLGTGKVLFTCGEGINGVSIDKAELHNPSTGKFTATGNITATREEHTGVARQWQHARLGWKQKTITTQTPLASAELYTPTGGTWTATGSMSNARASNTSTVLHNMGISPTTPVVGVNVCGC